MTDEKIEHPTARDPATYEEVERLILDLWEGNRVRKADVQWWLKRIKRAMQP